MTRKPPNEAATPQGADIMTATDQDETSRRMGVLVPSVRVAIIVGRTYGSTSNARPMAVTLVKEPWS